MLKYFRVIKSFTMKKAFLSLVAIATSVAALAQLNAAKVTYDEKITFKINLEGEAAQFANLMPKEQKGVKELHFNQSASIFMAPEKKEEEEINQTTENGGQIKIKMARPDEKSYCDLKSGKKIEQKDFMSRKFLVESELGTAKDWKLTGNQKMILGYPCQEATKGDSTKKAVAWFTPAIPVSVGPSGFEGLPGLVLEVSAGDGQYTLLARTVEAGKENTALLVKPSEGKKMSKEAYDKMVDEKTKEMQQEYGGGAGSGGGNVIIKMRTN